LHRRPVIPSFLTDPMAKNDQIINIGLPLPSRAPHAVSERPDWQQAAPVWIDKALAYSQSLPSGGWYVVDSSEQIGTKPRPYRICGEDWVAWRHQGEVRFAPASCPHLGADLACADVVEGKLRCPWHGLLLGADGHGKWRLQPTFDDGTLVWVQLGDDADDKPPRLAPRPAVSIDGVIRQEAVCEPEDVIANRLDPWHGVHFHPHSFTRLKILEMTPEIITIRVAYRVIGPICVEVDATFHCPDPRTIVMTIIAGDGKGSVVSTHATPIEAGRTAVVEATFATSERVGFRYARLASGITKKFIEARARRLWVEDAEYAERRYKVRASKAKDAKRRLPKV